MLRQSRGWWEEAAEHRRLRKRVTHTRLHSHTLRGHLNMFMLVWRLSWRPDSPSVTRPQVAWKTGRLA